MPFDTSRWAEPATRSELADACMAASRGMDALIAAIDAIRSGKGDKASEELASAAEYSTELDSLFDQLSGYRSGEQNNE